MDFMDNIIIIIVFLFNITSKVGNQSSLVICPIIVSFNSKKDQKGWSIKNGTAYCQYYDDIKTTCACGGRMVNHENEIARFKWF
jgi:hypothetical protein